MLNLSMRAVAARRHDAPDGDTQHRRRLGRCLQRQRAPAPATTAASWVAASSGLQVGGHDAAVFGQLDHHALVQPDVHRR